ncbi:MAG: endonuclease/exonuclease/phosphatase family protein [Patescibacteria group bacterium]
MQETFSLIVFNTWNGRRWEEYVRFLEDTKSSTDIYCFQEVLNGHEPGFTKSTGSRINHITETTKILNAGYVAFANRQAYFKKDVLLEFLPYGIATVHDINHKRNLRLTERQDIFLVGAMDSCDDPYAENVQLPVVIQKIRYETFDGKPFYILNLHGYWQDGIGKGDHPVRLEQTKKLVTILEGLDAPWVLAGDFNMNLNSESIRLLEALPGARNLIREYEVTTTRTSLYPEVKRLKEPHADYIFVKNIAIDSFRVDPGLLVSDHAPMYLDFGVV